MAKQSALAAIAAMTAKFEAEKQKLLDGAKEEMATKLRAIKASLETYNTEAAELSLATYIIAKADKQGTLFAGVGAKAGSRVRKSKEELEAIAKQALDLLATKGKDGSGAGDLAKVLNFTMKPNPKVFIKKFANVEIEVAGKLKAAKYFYPKSK